MWLVKFLLVGNSFMIVIMNLWVRVIEIVEKVVNNLLVVVEMMIILLCDKLL